MGITLWLLGPAAVEAHRCLCNGDANLDGSFDDTDFFFTIECLGQLPIDTCVNADINGDGDSDRADFQAFQVAYTISE